MQSYLHNDRIAASSRYGYPDFDISQEIEIKAGETTEVTLTPAYNCAPAEVKVVVRDEAGKPLAFQLISLNWQPLKVTTTPEPKWPWMQGFLPSLRTNAQGEATFYPVCPGIWEASIFPAKGPLYDLHFGLPGDTALTKTRLDILPQGTTINIVGVRNTLGIERENIRPRRAVPLQP